MLEMQLCIAVCVFIIIAVISEIRVLQSSFTYMSMLHSLSFIMHLFMCMGVLFKCDVMHLHQQTAVDAFKIFTNTTERTPLDTIN